MRTNKKRKQLKTSVNTDIIQEFELSHHTQAILTKILIDLINTDHEMDFLYMEEEIFSIWPSVVVMEALNELAEADIMYMNICEDEGCEDCDGSIIFNPEILDELCPGFGVCECCRQEKVFNVNYN